MKTTHTSGVEAKGVCFHDEEDIIVHMFCYVDDRLRGVKKVAQADLYPSEVVTTGLLFALKWGYFRAFCRWLKRDDAAFG